MNNWALVFWLRSRRGLSDKERVLRRARRGKAAQVPSAEGKGIPKEGREAASQAAREMLRDIHRDGFQG